MFDLEGRFGAENGPGRCLKTFLEAAASSSPSMSPWGAMGTPFVTILIDSGSGLCTQITHLAPNTLYSSPRIGFLAPNRLCSSPRSRSSAPYTPHPEHASRARAVFKTFLEAAASSSPSMGLWRATGTPFMTVFMDFGHASWRICVCERHICV